MKRVADLNVPRSCHGLCSTAAFIYIIAGYSNSGLCLQNEKYNVSSKKCVLLNDRMQIPVANPGLCVFNDAVYKFGGLGPNQTLSQSIERLGLESEVWETVEFRMPEREQLMMSPACVQINQTQILVIGGQDPEERPCSQVLVFQPSSKLSEPSVLMETANNLSLPSPFGFVMNEGLFMEGQVYFLQNKEAGNDWNEDRKRLLVFNGREWHATE